MGHHHVGDQRHQGTIWIFRYLDVEMEYSTAAVLVRGWRPSADRLWGGGLARVAFRRF